MGLDGYLYTEKVSYKITQGAQFHFSYNPTSAQLHQTLSKEEPGNDTLKAAPGIIGIRYHVQLNLI